MVGAGLAPVLRATGPLPFWLSRIPHLVKQQPAGEVPHIFGPAVSIR